MDEKKISIIIPVHNAEKYLDDTITSLLKQTMKEIEIILINNNSKDNSIGICEKYAQIDNRIIVIDKDGIGLAETRNIGLNAADGKYIMFLDSDDMYKEDACEHMYNIIEETESDYVVGNYQMMDDDGTIWKNAAFGTEKYECYELKKHDYEKSFFVMNSTVWNKIYNKEFLRANGIAFNIPSPSEDDYFTSMCYIKAKKGYYTSKVMYLYRNTTNSLSKDCSLKYFKGINNAYKNIYELFINNNEINYYRYVYAKKNAYLLCQLIDSNLVNDEEKIQCIKDLNWYFKLRDNLKVGVMNKSLEGIMQLIKDEEYEKLIDEFNKMKEYRKTIPEKIRKRMSFPTRENYKYLEKDSKEFIN